MTAVNLEDITAVVAAAIALLAMLATLLVGRWQLRGALTQASAALDAVTATAARNHDHWRRSVQRDAYVQFLVAVTEVERVRYPRNEEDTESSADAWPTAEEALNQAVTAFYILRLESPDLSDVAHALLETVDKFTRANRRHAKYLRAMSVIMRIERETGTHFTSARRALEELQQVAQSTDAALRQQQFGPTRRTAAAALGRIEALTSDYVNALLSEMTSPSDIAGKRTAVREARETFLEAARQRLEASQ
ncbi:hypothetical protein [Streptomyces massasporeus]|uniref:hypothetical protein n=1 Tax=Streptomyces massasporeus TaxID=67324 RepID=UPI0037005642